jgi:ketosteroid isomerase-like protein
MFRPALILALALSSASLPAQAVPSVTLPPALDRILRDYETHWGTGDAAAVSRLFAPDGFALPSGKLPARGHDAIRKAYEGNQGSLQLRALAYATADSVGWIIGAYSYDRRTEPDVGKFVLALRKDGAGRWLVAADIDNSNTRP